MDADGYAIAVEVREMRSVDARRACGKQRLCGIPRMVEEFPHAHHSQHRTMCPEAPDFAVRRSRYPQCPVREITGN